MQFTWVWVKGHARRRKQPLDFTWEESLNDYADILATEAREASSRQTALLARFSSFVANLRSRKTSKSLIAALQAGAMAWAEQREPPTMEGLNLLENRLGDLIWLAYTEQTSLGWNVLFLGFWVTFGQLAQEEQFCMYPSREVQDTGEIWAAYYQLWFYDTFEALW
jgi:hypothetical protein